MLLGFSIENWMSFRDEGIFSMYASRERQHNYRVSRPREGKMRVLPVAAVYGGNASGKSNFCQALRFCKDLITGRFLLGDTIPVQPFLLDDKDSERPSRFCFELLVEEDGGEAVYEFSFGITPTKVLEERLARVSGDRETVLYDRQDDEPNFHRSLKGDQFLHFAFQGTRDDTLFLTNAVRLNDDRFRPVYEWFAHTLHVVTSDRDLAGRQEFLDDEHPLYDQMNEVIAGLDTGISHLGTETIRIEESPGHIGPLGRRAREHQLSHVGPSRPGERHIKRDGDGALIRKRLVTYHERGDGTEVRFEMDQESDGSRRVIGLLPEFLRLSAPKARTVYVIDELDRSLHTLLTRTLISRYLSSCTEASRSQLVFTTHDVLLIDQRLLRRDEIWVTERDATGNSRLFSFSEFKEVRHDKDIRKSYLQGRMGGIPNVFLARVLTNPSVIEEDLEDD